MPAGCSSRLNEGSTSEESASYATDAYTVLAVAGDDGSLACAYLGYVDTINDRVELCRLASNTLCAAGSSDGGTLGSSFGEGGLAGLVDDVARLAGVDVAHGGGADRRPDGLPAAPLHGGGRRPTPRRLAAGCAGTNPR